MDATATPAEAAAAAQTWSERRAAGMERAAAAPPTRARRAEGNTLWMRASWR
jgi:hypothetical protein